MGEQWGESISGGVTAESWFYACNGTTAKYTGAPIPFAQMLEFMMPKFLAKLETLGFSSFHREAGTWRVAAAWGADEKEKIQEETTEGEDPRGETTQEEQTSLACWWSLNGW